MRKLAITGALATFMTASAAMAAPPAVNPKITFINNVYTFPANVTPTIFETFESGTNDTVYTGQPNQTTSPGYTETNGGSSLAESGVVPGRGINPDPSNDKYLAVNGNYTVGFGAAGVQFFSFVFGTLDTYNSLTLNFQDGTTLQLLGSAIVGVAATPAPGTSTYSPQLTGRVSYDTQGRAPITSAIFGSSMAAFEVDDLAAAAPEPATWAMMILGFGLAGYQLRLRRRKTQPAFA